MPDWKCNFCSKFSFKLFCGTVANADMKSLKSLHTFFDMYLDNMLKKFESNFMVQNYKIRAFSIKPDFLKTIFDKALRPFWKTFLLLKELFNGDVLIFNTIFQCSKNCDSPTRVTRLIVAPNMADPTSMEHPLSSLNDIKE